MQNKKIIHIDMDAFFAAVEQRENPKYKNKPLIVGGTSKRYGVVTSCSYEAREFGVKSAMTLNQALKLCPGAIIVNVRKDIYQKVSKQMIQIFKKYTDYVEPMSLDEAYLDVTQNKLNISSATELANIIKDDIKKSLNLTCSCGVSYNKFLAKTASDVNKPDGVFVITPKIAINYLENLSINKFYGIGKKTTQKMISLGIYSGLDLKKFTKEELTKHFKNQGVFYYNIVRGIDKREVIPNRPIHSVGNEHTLVKTIIKEKEIYQKLSDVFEISYTRLSNKNIFPKTITIKLRFENQRTITRSKTIPFHTLNKKFLYDTAYDILNYIELQGKIKLLGVTFSNFGVKEEYNSYIKNTQLRLF